MSRQVVTLTGYRASGKSTVGPLLAQVLKIPFIDADAALEKRSKRTIADIFATDGEPHFRALESETLTRLYAEYPDMVLSTGGGAILSEANRSLLQKSSTAVCYLQAEAAVLSGRLNRNAGNRPSLSGKSVAEEVAGILSIREPLYRACADVLIDASLPIEQVCEQVMCYLRSL